MWMLPTAMVEGLNSNQWRDGCAAVIVTQLPFVYSYVDEVEYYG